MKGVILAAGSGSRLSGHDPRRPKVLIPVAGQAIIEHTLQAFAQMNITDLAIVVGHQRHVMERWIGDGSRQGLRIQYINSPDYRLGNALSLHAAASFANDGPFLLSMADHMVSADLLARVLDVEGPDSVLAVDFGFSPRHLEEGTRTLVDEDGLITQIGKDLRRWNGTDAGVFRLDSAIFDALAYIIGQEGNEYQLSQAITRMIQSGHPLRAADVSGCFWHDVDTPEDLAQVRKTLAG